MTQVPTENDTEQPRNLSTFVKVVTAVDPGGSADHPVFVAQGYRLDEWDITGIHSADVTSGHREGTVVTLVVEADLFAMDGHDVTIAGRPVLLPSPWTIASDGELVSVPILARFTQVSA